MSTCSVGRAIGSHSYEFRMAFNVERLEILDISVLKKSDAILLPFKTGWLFNGVGRISHIYDFAHALYTNFVHRFDGVS